MLFGSKIMSNQNGCGPKFPTLNAVAMSAFSNAVTSVEAASKLLASSAAAGGAHRRCWRWRWRPAASGTRLAGNAENADADAASAAMKHKRRRHALMLHHAGRRSLLRCP